MRGVPLSEVTERFFDAKLWNEYLSCFPDRDAALHELSHPEQNFSGCFRRPFQRHPELHNAVTRVVCASH
jgi:hypothetical protein